MTAHKSVLEREVLDLLGCAADKNFIDATLGAGGHTEAILRKTSPKGIVVAFERDLTTCKVARDRLRIFGRRFRLIENNFSGISGALCEVKDGFDGVLWDLGISSIQLEDPMRGFSFSREGPVDMRIDQRMDLTAEEVVNECSPDELERIFVELGEERFAKAMARNIIRERTQRRISSSLRLADILSRAVPVKFRKRGLHPATKAFMALRIFVNDELESLKKSLEGSMDVVKAGGRLAVISFHSLEDRVVKNFFRDMTKRCTCPRDLPRCICNTRPRLKIITSKPIRPGNEEVSLNPRSRSAKLRVAEVL